MISAPQIVSNMVDNQNIICQTQSNILFDALLAGWISEGSSHQKITKSIIRIVQISQF